MSLKYVAVNPDQDLVFNTANQSPYFCSLRACEKGIFEELDERVAEDLDTHETLSAGQEYGRQKRNYRIFKEVKTTCKERKG